jgi:hypothetical protein
VATFEGHSPRFSKPEAGVSTPSRRGRKSLAPINAALESDIEEVTPGIKLPIYGGVVYFSNPQPFRLTSRSV